MSYVGRKKARSGSFIATLLPIAGVAVGVFAFTVVLSVMSGFVSNIKKSLLNMQPHIEILANEKLGMISEDRNLIKQIQTLSKDIVQISPYQKADAILQVGQKAIMVSLLGIDVKGTPIIFSPKQISDLSLSLLNTKVPLQGVEKSALFPTIWIGYSVAQEFFLSEGDSVTLVSPVPDSGPGGMAPLQFPVVISGIYSAGSTALGHKLIVTSIETANSFLQTPQKWMGLHVKLKEPMEAERVAKELNLIFSKDENRSSVLKNLYAKSWTENNVAFLRALNLEHYGMMFVTGMVIVVGCFSISIVLLLSVRRRTSEMAIFRSIGLTKCDLSRLYLWQGLIIGVTGVLVGIVTGAATLYLIHNYSIPFISSSYSRASLPVSINYYEWVFVSVGSVLLSVFAAVWPAIEVKNLDIIQILSYQN